MSFITIIVLSVTALYSAYNIIDYFNEEEFEAEDIPWIVGSMLMCAGSAGCALWQILELLR